MRAVTEVDGNLVLTAVMRMRALLPDHALEDFEFVRDSNEDIVARAKFVGRRTYSTVMKSCWMWPELSLVPIHAPALTSETNETTLMTWVEECAGDTHGLAFVKTRPHLLVHVWVEDDPEPAETMEFVFPLIRSVVDVATTDAAKAS